MESFVKSYKRECADHIVFTSAGQLEYCTREYLEWYNHERPHRGLGGRMIHPWPQDPDGEIVEFSRLGGLPQHLLFKQFVDFFDCYISKHETAIGADLSVDDKAAVSPEFFGIGAG